MRVDEWFTRWQVRVVEQSGRADWPDSPEYWSAIRRQLIQAGATFEASCEALDAIGLEGWGFPSDFPKRLATALPGAFKRIAAIQATGESVDDRSTAERLSRDCPECAGGGITIRRFRREGVPGGMTAGVICHQCPMGRWVASRWAAAKGPRPIDLRDRADLRGQDWREPFDDEVCEPEWADAVA